MLTFIWLQSTNDAPEEQGGVMSAHSLSDIAANFQTCLEGRTREYLAIHPPTRSGYSFSLGIIEEGRVELADNQQLTLPAHLIDVIGADDELPYLKDADGTPTSTMQLAFPGAYDAFHIGDDAVFRWMLAQAPSTIIRIISIADLLGRRIQYATCFLANRSRIAELLPRLRESLASHRERHQRVTEKDFFAPREMLNALTQLKANDHCARLITDLERSLPEPAYR